MKMMPYQWIELLQNYALKIQVEPLLLSTRFKKFLREDNFMPVIMIEFQAMLFTKFSAVVCVDSHTKLMSTDINC